MVLIIKTMQCSQLFRTIDEWKHCDVYHVSGKVQFFLSCLNEKPPLALTPFHLRGVIISKSPIYYNTTKYDTILNSY